MRNVFAICGKVLCFDYNFCTSQMELNGLMISCSGLHLDGSDLQGAFRESWLWTFLRPHYAVLTSVVLIHVVTGGPALTLCFSLCSCPLFFHYFRFIFALSLLTVLDRRATWKPVTIVQVTLQ
jgi:hypothetical protein